MQTIRGKGLDSAGVGPAGSDIDMLAMFNEAQIAAARGITLEAPAPPLDLQRPKARKRSSQERKRDTIKSMEEEVALISNDLERLTSENQLLVLRKSVLEPLVQLREEHLELLRKYGPPNMHAPGRGPASPTSSGSAGSGSSSSSGSSRPNSESPLLPGDHPDDDEYAMEVKFMKPEAARLRYRGYVREASDVLLRLDINPGDEDALGRLQQLHYERHRLLTHICVLNVPALQHIYTAHLVEGKAPPPQLAHPGYQQRILSSLKLSDAQKSQLVAAYHLFRSQLDSAPGTLHLLQETLLGSAENWDANPGSPLQRLSEAFTREHVALLMMLSFFIRVLTIEQAARCAMEAFPAFPDTVCLVQLLVEEARSMGAPICMRAFSHKWAELEGRSVPGGVAAAARRG